MARILIVDDEEMDRVLLAHVLEQAGHQAVFAPNGRIALRIWLREPADLIVTDIQMPELNGLDLIKVLRKGDPWVRIIAISGVRADRLVEAQEVGALQTLQKPVDPMALLALVEETLEGHGHWRDVEA